ncbi:MAG: Gfo/Idh/MocA family oxidoreductase [Chloroflexota bacterium]
MAKRKLGLAMVGIGVGGTEMLPAMEEMEELDLVAGADLNEETVAKFAQRYNATGYTSYEEMLKDDRVEAVWVSTPNRFHAQHSIMAMNAGKHVVVEKPMALNLDDAKRMVEAAHKNNVVFVAGHTRSFNPAIRMMWRILQSGRIGKVRAINAFAYTDWMLRPRTAEELDMAQGGGLPTRQLPHQVDTVRLLGGGKVRSVRGITGQWMPERPIPGYYSALLEFEDGTSSIICHNGYGYSMGAELVQWGHDRQRYTAAERVEVRRQMREGVRKEEDDKQALRIGGLQEREVFKAENRELWVPEDLGLLIVSGERGDMRHGPEGVLVYDDTGKEEVPLNLDRAMGPGWRRAELEELYDAVVDGKPVFHTGEWGVATLEVVLAVSESAKAHKELIMQNQVPVHARYGEARTFSGSAV